MTNRLSNAATAERLGIEPNTLERWRMRGVGPAYYRIAGRIFYDPADIDNWIAAQRVDHTQRTAG